MVPHWSRFSRAFRFARVLSFTRLLVWVHWCIMFEIIHFGHCLARWLPRRERPNPPFPTNVLLLVVAYKYIASYTAYYFLRDIPKNAHLEIATLGAQFLTHYVEVVITIYMITHARDSLLSRDGQSKDVTFRRNDLARAETEGREAVSRAEAALRDLGETELERAAAIARPNHKANGK